MIKEIKFLGIKEILPEVSREQDPHVLETHQLTFGDSHGPQADFLQDY